jgi:hypothetical protein
MFLIIKSYIKLQSLTNNVLFFFARMPSILFASRYLILRKKGILLLNLTFTHAVLLFTIITKRFT